MSNNRDFKVKNGIQPTVYHEAVGTVVSGSVRYNLAGASYDNKSFSVASQDTEPHGLYFKSDGLKMYFIGNNTDNIYQYTLSTAWDISTASYDSKSFSIGTQDFAPRGVFLKDDGTKAYIIGAGTVSIYEYDLSTAHDISTASYNGVSFSVASQDGATEDIFFKPDGTKLYVCGNQYDTVFQYSLSTAWDLSTASFDSVAFSVATEDTFPQGLSFKSDGTKMFIVGSNVDSVYQYNLSTAWDLSTASYDSVSFDISSQEIAPTSVFFKSDGAKMYIVGYNTDTIYQYSTVQTTNTLDLSSGSVFEITPTSDIQVTLSNPADSGTVSGATLLLSAVGTEYTLTYDTAIEWPSGTAPTSPSIGETDVITFNTRDGGSTYSGVLAIDGAS